MSDTPVTISAAQRNALYRLILIDLSGFIDLQTAFDGEKADLETCYRLGRRVTDGLRLIQDGGLGWGNETPGELVELTLPAEELRRILTEQQDQLVAHREATRPEREDTEAEWQLDATALSACEDALSQLAGGGGR